MQSRPSPFTRFAIFKDSQLIERADGDTEQAKARLEHYSNITPDHNWWFVTYGADDEIPAAASRTVH